jgi:hypothetical protein
MVAAGIKASDADGWIVEVGSPTRYSFLLTFTGTDFTHSQETPDSPMQEGESGTFTFSGTQLLLNIGDAGYGDTYTLQATLSGDELSLRYIDSTELGTAEDKATHRRYTIAFYGSAGAGFASLRHILELRPAFVKLDRSLIAGLESDEARQAMIVGLRHFARSVGCLLIAEGIETEAELEVLRSLEIQLAQGFLLGRPRPVADHVRDGGELRPGA